MTILFLHIPKTAGTTLLPIIKRQFQKNEILELYPHLTGRYTNWEFPLEEYSRRSKQDNLALVVGHFKFGMHRATSNNFKYITMLQDPRKQIVSHYNHFLRSDKPLHREILQKCPTLSEFSHHNLARHFQIQRVTGASREKIDANPKKWLQQAKQNLLEHFSWVGISEKFDESLVLLGSVYGWRDLSYLSLNTAKLMASELMVQQISVGSLTEEQISCLEDAAVLDMELYSFAVNLLDEKLKNVKDLNKQVEVLRINSERLKNPIWRKLKRVQYIFKSYFM